MQCGRLHPSHSPVHHLLWFFSMLNRTGLRQIGSIKTKIESITPHSLSMGCTWWLPSRKYNMERGGQNSCMVEKLGVYDLSQFIQVNTSSGKSCSQYVFWYNVMKMVLYFCDLPPANPQPEPYNEKNIRKITTEAILQNTWSIFLKTVMVIKNRVREIVTSQGSLRTHDH